MVLEFYLVGQMDWIGDVKGMHFEFWNRTRGWAGRLWLFLFLFFLFSFFPFLPFSFVTVESFARTLQQLFLLQIDLPVVFWFAFSATFPYRHGVIGLPSPEWKLRDDAQG